MRIAILAALLFAAAPAFAQSNLGNTQKDSATSDAQRNKEDSSQTANPSSSSATPSSDTSSSAKSSDSSIPAKGSAPSVGDSGAAADSSAASSSPSKESSVDQVRKDKKKGIARARAAKRQREKSGAEHWDPRSPSNNTAASGGLKTDDRTSPSSTGQ